MQLTSLRLASVMLASVFLVGCVSHGRPALNMSLSDVSEQASKGAVELTGSALSSSVNSVVSSSVDISLGPLWFGSHEYDDHDDDYYALDDHHDCLICGNEGRVLLGRRFGINLGASQYRLLNGYSLEFGYRENQDLIRFGLIIDDVAFTGAADEGLDQPMILGLEMTYQHLPLILNDNIAFAVGGQFNTNVLMFNYDNPLFWYGERIDDDGVAQWGIGVPAGVIIDQGFFTMQAMVTPTITFHDSVTSIGFTNDIFTVHGSMPITLSFGARF